MRLTLRTLLAYLDDRLAPSDARELGQKVTKSPFASELADRIKDVQRRRRLADDSTGHKSIDANLVAEYLDDQLTPELVGLIEKEILASDRSLAEVAASHQIIGTLGESPEIGSRLSERLYALGPELSEGAANGGLEEAVAHNEAAAAWEPLEAQRTAVRRTPLILLSAMALGWLVLVTSDSNLFRRENTVVKTAPNRAAVVGIEDADLVDAAGNGRELDNIRQVDGGVETSSVTDKGRQSVVANAAKKESGTASTAGFSVSKDAGETVTPVVAKITQSDMPDTKLKMEADVSERKLAANVETPVSVPPLPAADADVKEKKISEEVRGANGPEMDEIKQDPVYHLVDVHSMLLLRRDEDATWEWASQSERRDTDKWNQELTESVAGVTAPFSVNVAEIRSGWSTEFLGPALFSLDGENAAGVRLYEGRALLVNRNSVKGTEDAIALTLLAGGRQLRIFAPPNKGAIGIQVLPRTASEDEVFDAAGQTELLPLHHSVDVLICAPTHDVVVMSGNSTEPVSIAQGTALLWKGRAGDGESTLPEVDDDSVLSIPEWVFEATQRKADSTQEVMDAAAAGLKAHSSISSGVRAMSRNRNPQLAGYAIKVPALMREVDELVAFLVESDEDVVRLEAASGLRQVVLQSQAGLASVVSALENRMSEVEVKNVTTLLQGVSPTAAEDRDISGWLVSMLSSNRTCIQSLAIANLEALTQERYGYFAGDDSGRRETAAKRWKRYLNRNDGRLKTANE